MKEIAVVFVLLLVGCQGLVSDNKESLSDFSDLSPYVGKEILVHGKYERIIREAGDHALVDDNGNFLHFDLYSNTQVFKKGENYKITGIVEEVFDDRYDFDFQEGRMINYNESVGFRIVPTEPITK